MCSWEKRFSLKGTTENIWDFFSRSHSIVHNSTTGLQKRLQMQNLVIQGEQNVVILTLKWTSYGLLFKWNNTSLFKISFSFSLLTPWPHCCLLILVWPVPCIYPTSQFVHSPLQLPGKHCMLWPAPQHDQNIQLPLLRCPSVCCLPHA